MIWSRKQPESLPPEETRDRVIRSVREVLGSEALDVNVTFTPTDSNEVQILAVYTEWQCMFTVPIFESSEAIVRRIQALLAARDRNLSSASDSAPNQP